MVPLFNLFSCYCCFVLHNHLLKSLGSCALGLGNLSPFDFMPLPAWIPTVPDDGGLPPVVLGCVSFPGDTSVWPRETILAFFLRGLWCAVLACPFNYFSTLVFFFFLHCSTPPPPYLLAKKRVWVRVLWVLAICRGIFLYKWFPFL